MMKVIFLILLFSLNLYGRETWVHRAVEKVQPSFSYSDNCEKMNFENFNRIFDFSKLIQRDVKGIEVDSYYNAKLDKLLLFHKSKKYDYGSINYQCFQGQFIETSDFLKYFSLNHPNIKIWLDLKNDNLLELIKARNVLEKIKLPNYMITELQNIFAIPFFNSPDLQTSYWLKDDSYLKMNFAKWFGVNRLSNKCNRINKGSNIVKSGIPIMCWGELTQKTNQIKTLSVILK